MTRQHVDLEIVRAKLEGRRGGEAYTSAGFFRDLLLLCNNAIVFYPKSSPESVAAVHLRGLVNKEMARTIRNTARPPKAEESTRPAPPLPPPPPVSKLKSDADRCASKPLHKPTSLVPLIACRKRSSLSGLAAGTKGEKEKPPVDRKERELEDETATKKRTKERSIVSGPRGLRSNKTRVKAENRVSGVSKSPNSVSTQTAKSTAIENSVEPMAKSEKIGGGVVVSASKKRGAAEFLNRMKRSSPTSNRTLLNTPRSSASSSGGGKGGERLKKVGRGNGKDRDSRQPTGAATSKRAAKPSVPVKRSVGRPPKRGAAPPTPPLAKKAKAEVGRTSPLSRKRGRR